MATPPSASTGFAAVALPAHARGMAFGGTGSGKSTLEEHLIGDWLRRYPDARVLIDDSKPRFRADWQLNGLSAKRVYRKWGHGASVSDSVLLPLSGSPDANLKQAWRLGHQVAIAQVDRVRGLDDAPWLLEYMRAFFADSSRKRHQLVAVDEMADFFSSSGAFGRGHPITQIARSGREVGCAMIGCSQRPRNIPPQVITEASQLYVFRLDYGKDLKHLQEHGMPDDAREPEAENAFLFYDKRRRRSGIYRLNLASAAAAKK